MCHLPWKGGKRDAAAASPLNCQCHLGSVIWGYHLSLLSSTKLWVVPWIFPLDVRGLTDPKLKPPNALPFLLPFSGRRQILQCKNLQENRFEGMSGVESPLGGFDPEAFCRIFAAMGGP